MMMMMMIPVDCGAGCCDKRSWHSTHCADTTPVSWLTTVDSTAVSKTVSVPAADADCCTLIIVDVS